MTFIALVPNMYFNVKQYGAAGDGTTDDTAAIAAARSAARTAGGGTIFYPTGTYISGNQDISNDVGIFHLGAGKQATIVKLKNGANTDLFSGQTGLINLSAAGGTSAQGTLYTFGFANMTLDGNKANQTAGPSYPLRFYGYNSVLENLEVKNGYTGNILSDWNAGASFAPADSMECQWTNVKTHDSNGIGIQYGGPHDSLFMNITPFKEGSHCLHLAPNANGAQFTHLHAWGPGQQHLTTQTTYGVDTFVRANQSGLGTSSDTQVWTEAPASGNVTASIATNQANFTGNGTEAESVFTLGSTSVGNIDFTARIHLGGDSTNNYVGLAWHFADINNYYRAVITGNVLYLQKYVASVKSTVTSTAFTLGNNTYAWIRVQQSGTTIVVKAWLDGAIQPASWQITTTDSSLGAGKFGLASWINSSTARADNFLAKSIYVQSNCTSFLCETHDVLCSNCEAESSDTVQLVVLGSGFEWVGGNLYDGPNSQSTGVQIGQQAGNTPYLGQIYQSAGVTTAVNPQHCRMNTYIYQCQGGNGSIWLANDGGYNLYDVTINQVLAGVDRVGGVAAHSVLKETYNDGTLTTTGLMQLDSGIMLNKAGTLYSGSGAPSNATGSIGDYYFRTDTPSTFLQRLYVKTAAAAWTELQTPVESAAAAATATAGTITTAGIDSARVAPIANITGVILQAGTYAGQVVKVVNESAFTVTFAASGTSFVATGILAQIAPLSACLFQWDSITALWYPATVVLLPVQSATAVATATSGTIATAGLDESRVSPAGAVTGVILASGTYAGQKVTVVNEAVAANTVTFAVQATSHVSDGVSSVIAGLAARTFIYDTGTSLWYPCK